MAIASVIHKGNFAYVKDEKGRQLCLLNVPSSNGAVLGWTATIVTVKKGNFIYTYNEKGHQKSCSQA